jgi:L-cysteine S-thiosulfotransferase
VHPIPGAAFILVTLCVLGANLANAQTDQRRSRPPAEASNPLTQLIAGEEFLLPAMRALQADDFDNPAYSLVEAGEAAWSAEEGAAGKSCQNCHGAGRKNTLKSIAASYPKYAPDMREVVRLETRINVCRRNNLRAPPFDEGSDRMTTMVAYLRWLARGTPSTVDVTGPNAEVFQRGAKLYEKRLGLLQLSCAQCHNERFGQKFSGDTLSQGHPLAYPVFKSGEGRVVTLHERFRICNRLARAEGQPDNSPDYVGLELYISWRSKNLPITAPGVRP